MFYTATTGKAMVILSYIYLTKGATIDQQTNIVSNNMFYTVSTGKAMAILS